MHLYCVGERRGRAPTVVLESGAGDTSAEWSLVQPEVAKFARVCSYDRSGSGWSDLGPYPHSGHQIAYELGLLLDAANESGPYVGVGHSMGGRYLRLFSAMSPGRVAGIVFVDSNHEDDLLGINGKLQRQWETATGQPIPAARNSGPLRIQDIPAEARAQMEAAAKRVNSQADAPPYNKLPGWAREARRWSWSQIKSFAANNSPFDGDEALALRNERLKIAHPLADLPVVVLTRGQSVTGPMASEREAERKQHQAELVDLSTRGKQIIASNSGHHIQIDEPDVVVRAIRDLMNSVSLQR